MRGAYPPGSLADLLLSDRERKAAVHVAAFVEQECPGAIDIFCNCGWYGHTLWGQEQAKILFAKHKFQHGANPKVTRLA
jgi:hypothetical protein